MIGLLFSLAISFSTEAKPVFRKILANAPINLSPHLLEDEYSVQLMRQCMVGLVTLADDSKLEAGLASNIESQESSGTRVTIELPRV